MGMNADILAIGLFSTDIVVALEYPPEFYAHTRPGVPVIAPLFDSMPHSSTSNAFATCVGITDPWDFNQHKIDPWRVDLDGLRRLFTGLYEPDPSFLIDLDHFKLLRARRFDFFFRPNG